MMTDDEMAARMFGSQVHDDPAPNRGQQSSIGEHKPTTDAEKAERMFGRQEYGDAKRAIQRAAIEDLATREEAASRAEVMAEHFRALGLNSTEASRLADLRGNPTPEAREVWREDATKALRQDYGDAAGDVLNDVRAYIAQHPKLRDHLRNTGLGDHPQWVRTVAAKAREARKAGKLK